ncbi:MAG: zinc finger domain-containing protein [Candidatus Pacearchaeota archaeon]|nr:zinc finger domain-containing protein [Candidatus Pacearchaeota archaeon]
MKCVSCEAELQEGSVIFTCPSCKRQIARCGKCRKLSVKYKCGCNFEGP